MPSPEEFDRTLDDCLTRIMNEDVTTDGFGKAVDNYTKLSHARPSEPEPTPDPEPVPETAWEKVKDGATKIWESETTRVLIKAAGAFAGVALVVSQTIHRDRVLEKTALAQANQNKV